MGVHLIKQDLDDAPWRWIAMARAHATHVAVPLDPAQIDDAAVEVMARALCDKAHDENPEANTQWDLLPDDGEAMWKADARAALTALLAHLAEAE